MFTLIILSKLHNTFGRAKESSPLEFSIFPKLQHTIVIDSSEEKLIIVSKTYIEIGCWCFHKFRRKQ